MPPPDLLYPFAQQIVERRVERGHRVPVVRIGEESLFHATPPRKQCIVPRVGDPFDPLPRLFADADHRQIRQDSQHLLAPQHPEVDSPVVDAQFDAPGARNEIHCKQRSGLARDPAQGLERRDRPARRFAMNRRNQTRPEGKRFLAHLLKIRNIVERRANASDVRPERRRHIRESFAEKAVHDAQNPISRPKDALERSPQGEHSLSRHGDDALIRRQEEGLQLRLDRFIEFKKVLLKIRAPEVLRVSVEMSFFDRYGPRDETNRICPHAIDSLRFRFFILIIRHRASFVPFLFSEGRGGSGHKKTGLLPQERPVRIPENRF